MARYFIHFAYNGAAYHGWQNQPNGISIQQLMEQALSNLLGSPTAIVGAGRTDAGVHASDMYAHFDSSSSLPAQLSERLNAYLPQDIVIFDIYAVSDDMHARFSALERTYQYHVITRKDPFKNDHCMRVSPTLDFDTMNEAAAHLLYYEDFSCFCKTHTDVKTKLCHVSQAVWTRVDEDEWVFTITANRFLRNMVRAIVGTLLDVGTHKIDLQGFVNIIEQKNRCLAGMSAPAKALFLTHIDYPPAQLV